ncbi:MAG: hypothetical protein J0H29_15990 [Sphingobacteriales bacterium]|nr:hypothetical protein [Sphingobacteriales bacterium]OJY92434.1 MAG: hypothetical protein BGP14_14660 [Sphingobacteriales bacterium 44-15]
MDEKKEIIQSLSQWVALPDTGQINWEEFEHALQQRINDLILHDFQRLIEILYRVDIDEPGLKVLLKQEKDKDAALIISRLIIERQLQKIRDRKKFNSSNYSDEERW